MGYDVRRAADKVCPNRPLVNQVEEHVMQSSDARVKVAKWLRRPLCRRYAVIVFNTISGIKVRTEAGSSRTICWALGSLVNGDSEILGVWVGEPQSTTPSAVIDDLRNRGVESLRFGVGNLLGVEPPLSLAFMKASACPSIEQARAAALAAVKPIHRPAMDHLFRFPRGQEDEMATVDSPVISRTDLRERYPDVLSRWADVVARCEPLFDQPSLYNDLVRSADQTAFDIQQRVAKVVHRQGSFDDIATALEFVAVRLWRAERTLDRDVRSVPARSDTRRSSPGVLARAIPEPGVAASVAPVLP